MEPFSYCHVFAIKVNSVTFRQCLEDMLYLHGLEIIIREMLL